MEEMNMWDRNMMEQLEKEREKDKKQRRMMLLLCAVLLLILVIAAVAAYDHFRPKSKYELDRNALAGFLPGKTEEEIREELNRIIDEGRVNISINATPVVQNGKIDVRIENVPANRYYLQADIYIYPEQGNPDKTELLYRSGVLKQEYFIESADTEKVSVAPGEYDGIAVFSALDPETLEEIGKTSTMLVITIKD